MQRACLFLQAISCTPGLLLLLPTPLAMPTLCVSHHARADASRQPLPQLSVLAMQQSTNTSTSTTTDTCSHEPGDQHHHHHLHHDHHQCSDHTLHPYSSNGSSSGTSSSSGGSTAGSDNAASTSELLSPDHAAHIIKLNAFGDGYEDLAAAAVRGVEPRSHTGCWPAFAMLNHSCVPSAVHYVVGQTMVVRAVEDVTAGERRFWTTLGATLAT